ncbi:MAG: hypothetical protein NWR72_03745 [Bacteroidia bacterium]|nr:hypothetical protein [Bacteroidia bacterium]
MSRFLLVCFLFFAVAVIALGCQNTGAQHADEADTLGLSALWQEQEEDSLLDSRAICVWPIVGLRKESGRKNYTSDKESNYLVPIYYGERVELLGQYDTVKSEKRVYMKIRLQDGQDGWVYEELFEKHGRLAVMTGESELFRRPDMMTLRDESLMPGEIIVVLEKKGDWLHVSGSKKAKKGWVKAQDNFSLQQNDLKTALLFYKAKQARTPEQERGRLISILADQELKDSQLIPMVKKRLEELGPGESSTLQLDASDSETTLDED